MLNGASARPALQRAPPGERVHAAQAHAIRSKLFDYLRHLSRTSRRHRGSKRTRTADSPIAIIHPQAAEPIRFQVRIDHSPPNVAFAENEKTQMPTLRPRLPQISAGSKLIQ
jgi:hypothetical protein